MLLSKSSSLFDINEKGYIFIVLCMKAAVGRFKSFYGNFLKDFGANGTI